MALTLSGLYPILDARYLPACVQAGAGAGHEAWDEARHRMLGTVVRALAAAGVTVMQYRNKQDEDAQVLRDAVCLRREAPPHLRIVLNDRAHLVEASGCDGVHVGQGDLQVGEARRLVGERRIVGLSTHDEAQVRAGDAAAADYLAIGPVYATGSKDSPEPVVGLAGVRRARAVTQKPLVAIGGITLERAAEVRDAGADSVAVLSALFRDVETPLEKLAEDFLRLFR